MSPCLSHVGPLSLHMASWPCTTTVSLKVSSISSTGLHQAFCTSIEIRVLHPFPGFAILHHNASADLALLDETLSKLGMIDLGDRVVWMRHRTGEASISIFGSDAH